MNSRATVFSYSYARAHTNTHICMRAHKHAHQNRVGGRRVFAGNVELQDKYIFHLYHEGSALAAKGKITQNALQAVKTN